MKEVLVIDNYDSFVYNLVHYLEEFDARVTVKRNDSIDLEYVGNFDRIVLSPGPGVPAEAGILNELVKTYAPDKNILGVCLGQQAIGEVFGAELVNLNRVFHGVATTIHRNANDATIFEGLPEKFEVGRYHSWILEQLPDSLIPTSYAENGEVMSLRHRDFNMHAVQFHPESVLTPHGKKILRNWLELPTKAEKEVTTAT